MTEIQALEKLFIAEIENRLPFQSKAAIYKRLCEQGLVEALDIPHPRMPAIRVRGYQLAHAGRFLYCSSCALTEQEGPGGAG